MAKKGFYDYPYKKRMAMEAIRKDFMDTVTSLGSGFGGAGGGKERMSLYRLLTEHLSVALIDWANNTLDIAVSRCPYETGKLRSSGGFNLLVGEEGNVAGGYGAGDTSTKTISVDADDSGAYSLDVATWQVKQAARYISGVFFFDRTEKGVDIALYTHENLEPYVPRPKTEAQKGIWYATKEGTGPKYLEGPINEETPELRKAVRGAVTRALKAWRMKHKPDKTKGRKR